MQITEFDYELPKELIAQYPSDKRGESNLLVLHRSTGEVEHRKFYNIVEYLCPGDVLVLNETKVIPARLIGKRVNTGGRVEVFLLRPAVVNDTFGECGVDEWQVLISPHRVKKVGVKIEFGPDFHCEVKSVEPTPVVKFYYNGKFDTFLTRYGKVPLPPYIKREPDSTDYNRYQTVYARVPGACAAPTAGLHFTDPILTQLKDKGVKIVKIVLHTGVGTFKPVKCERVENHKIEPEYYEISPEVADEINSAKRTIACGTTTVRTLESGGEVLQASSGWTDKYIYPPYKFRVVDVLVTNFHLPKSTLLLLVCAFAGKELIFKAYKEAIAYGYKFYSYGDAMLII